MIKADTLSMSYGTLIFENVSFLLGNNEKVGLVGLNGCGKSTLLKVLMGFESPDKGTVELTKGEHIEYLPQEFNDSGRLDQFEFVGEFLESLVDDHLTEMWKVEKILTQLELSVDMFDEMQTRSPGQRMKLYVTSLLINEPTILLLDEPTNHLDIDGILWFERFLKKFKGIVILISHDRSFLNHVTNKIFEIDEQTLRVWDGNYDDFLEQKYDYIEERARLFKAQEKKRGQLETLIENSRKIHDAKKRGKAVRAAKKRMERELLRNEISTYEEKKINEVEISGAVSRTKLILEVKDVRFDWKENTNTPLNRGEEDILRKGEEDILLRGEEHFLLDDINLEIFGNEKIWFLGPNGTGKSTLVKLLIGELTPFRGLIRWGTNVKWEYFSQDQSHLPLDQKVADYFMRETGCSFSQSFGLMEQFLFDKPMREMQIGRLSPGQRARLSFAVFTQHQYDCLILDEPTNHLDIGTKEVIETALKDFKGAIILISHDRYFSENIGPDRVVTIQEGVLEEV